MKGVPARPQLSRAFGPEQKLLQRERKTGVPGWTWGFAYLVVFLIALGFLTSLAWGVHRVSIAAGPVRPRFEREAAQVGLAAS